MFLRKLVGFSGAKFFWFDVFLTPNVRAHITSRQITSHHITSHHITSSHRITSHHITTQLRWETSILPQNLKQNLSSSEVEFFQNFDSLLVDFATQTGHDLMGDLQPPKDLFVEIRVLKDCGEIVTDSGTMILNEGTTHHVRRTDVEQLIRNGVVEQLSSEER